MTVAVCAAVGWMTADGICCGSRDGYVERVRATSDMKEYIPRGLNKYVLATNSSSMNINGQSYRVALDARSQLQWGWKLSEEPGIQIIFMNLVRWRNSCTNLTDGLS
jgi:hypothetical protein